MHNLIIANLLVSIFGFGTGATFGIVFENMYVQAFQILTQAEFGMIYSFASGFPGPVSIQVVALAGYLVQGFNGALLSVLSYIAFPTILGVLAAKYLINSNSTYIKNILDDIKPVIAAMLVGSIFMIFETSISQVGFMLALIGFLIPLFLSRKYVTNIFMLVFINIIVILGILVIL